MRASDGRSACPLLIKPGSLGPTHGQRAPDERLQRGQRDRPVRSDRADPTITWADEALARGRVRRGDLHRHRRYAHDDHADSMGRRLNLILVLAPRATDGGFCFRIPALSTAAVQQHHRIGIPVLLPRRWEACAFRE
jgi:hypothetical protein